MMRDVRYTRSARSLAPFGFALACAALALASARRVHAQEQFVLVDATFTATAQNTMKSQYAIAPLPAAPANWKTPVDWSNGSIHLRYEVLEKPTQLKTLGNICFENTNTLTCQPYPPPYSTPGVYQSDSKINSFWQYDVFDWTKKLDRVYVVLKDEKETIVQGSAQFYPTKLHVTVWVVPPGKSYKPPVSEENDGDAGTSLPPMRTDAGVNPLVPKPPTATAGQIATAPAQAVSSAGSGAAGRTTLVAAPKSGNPAPQPTDAGTPRSVRDYLDHGSTCSVRQGRAIGFGKLWGAIALACFVARRARRRSTCRHGAHDTTPT